MKPAPDIKVLLIDSDSDSREICLALFQHHGYTVAEAMDVQEGVRLAREMQPTVIVTDLVTRTAEGWLIPEQLRADPITSTVPVVAVTAYVFPDDQQRALHAGVTAFLPKPVDLVQLLRIVEKLAVRGESQ